MKRTQVSLQDSSNFTSMPAIVSETKILRAQPHSAHGIASNFKLRVRFHLSLIAKLHDRDSNNDFVIKICVIH